MPTAPTLTNCYRQICATAPVYDDSLGATNLHQVYLRWEISTTGDFTGEETLITRTPTRLSTEAADFITGGASETTPPLDAGTNVGFLEECRVTAPANGTHYIRYRYERWISGALDSSGAYSSATSVAVTGAAAAAFGGTYDPIEDEPGALYIQVQIGRSLTDLDSVDQISYSAVALQGPSAHTTRVQNLIDTGLNASYVVDSPFGQRRGISDQSAETTIPVRYPHGKTAADSNSRTSLMRPADTKQQGIDISGATGASIEDMVDEFVTNWQALRNTGVRLISYGAPPLDFRHKNDSGLLLDDNMLGLLLESGMLLAFDSCARDLLTDPNTGEDTPVKTFLDWWNTNHSTKPLFIEPGLRVNDITDVLDTYSFVNTYTLFDDLFVDADYANDRTLTYKANTVNPASYSSRVHLVLGAENTCQRIADQAAISDAAKMEAMTVFVEDIRAKASYLRPLIGPDVFIANNITASQVSRMNNAVAVDATVTGGLDFDGAISRSLALSAAFNRSLAFTGGINRTLTFEGQIDNG